MNGRGADLTLPGDWTSAWLVILVAAAMGFLACLGVAAASAGDALARSWTQELSTRATVGLVAAAPLSSAQDAATEPDGATGDGAEAAAADLVRALEILRAAPGVAAAEPVGRAEMAALLEPWIGDGEAAAGLPLPRLIDLRLAPGAPLDAADLEARLRAAGLDAEIDAHERWIARLAPAAERIRAFAYGALAILGLAAGLTVALACSASLATQSKIIDVLKLVGARDGYISGVFTRRFQRLALIGSAAGAAIAVLALLAAPAGGGATGGPPEIAPLLPDLRPTGYAWARFALVPLAFAAIATLAARLAVTLALRRRAD